EVTGEKGIPVTLSSLGQRLLQKKWATISPAAELEFLGARQYQTRTYKATAGDFVKREERKTIEQAYFQEAFVTESYHGGRNEQFWFGPCFEDNWSDFDLSSAYPTAMSIIGKPDWEKMYQTTNVGKFKPDTLGYCWVDFEFPKNTRYPCIPVRTA